MENAYTLPVILLVSAEARKINLLKQTLKNHFYVMEASDMKSALEWMNNMIIDILIVDEQVAGSTVLNFCRQVRKISSYTQIPIFLISNQLKKTFTLQALNAGVSDFLNEPLDKDEVFQRLAVAEKSQNLQKKVASLSTHIKKTPSVSIDAKVFLQRFLLGGQALKEVTKAKKTGQPFSLLIIEIDDFKILVKKAGAEVVEDIMRGVISLLTDKLRKLDMLFPQTEGRFIMILPKTSQRAAHQIAETIRQEVSEAPLLTKKKTFSLTVSIGLVSFNETSAPTAYEHLDQLLTAMHRALSEAKKTGNRIVSKGKLS